MHLEIEQRIKPTDPEYARFKGADGRDVFLVYGKPYYLSDMALGRHCYVLASDEREAEGQAYHVFARLSPKEWDDWQR